MKRVFFLLTLGAALTACKPTPRTNPGAKGVAHEAPPAAQPAQTTQPAPPPPAADRPAPAAPPAATPVSPAAAPTDAIIMLTTTQQEYSPLVPWEKQKARATTAMGIYLGEGRVLTPAAPLKAATYAELVLPDESRRVPARILRRDDDLNLALVTVAHEEDAAFFENRRAAELGRALGQGEQAVLAGLVNGLTPISIPLQVQGATDGVPRLCLRMAAPLPEGHASGAPVLLDGKLAGLSAGYEASTQTLNLTNADLIARFLEEGHETGTPLLGVQFTELDDPVLRRYLELPEGQTGLYIGKVIPGSAAESAGLAVGDVITAVEGMPMDSRGRINHPLYGPIPAASALRILKPLGENIELTLVRHGELLSLPVPLNRAAAAGPLRGENNADEAPRYILWGGLLFQPLTAAYLDAVRGASKGDLPLSFQRLTQQEKELAEAGISEVTGLTLIIPTPATLGYENARFCVVKAVNGKTVRNFAEFEQLLDEPTEDNITALQLDSAPYTLYIDRSAAEAANDLIRRRGIPTLRVTGPTTD